jgi:signal transduction histidine kinase
MNELEKRNDLLQENIRLQEDIERISNHDLKGPMTVFLNVPDMLMVEKNLTPDQVEMLHLLKQSALRLMEMIHRTLDLYKMEKGTYLVKPVRVNLVKVLREIFRELDGLARKKGISLMMRREQDLVGPDDVFPLQGEEPLFYSLLSNLIQNALEASPEGKEVLVTLSASPQPSVSIRNDGAIPPQIRARFLERYATFGKERGTGLGAYSARLMTRTLGGNLSFTSSESDGTTLVVNMPSFVPESQSPAFSVP